MRLKPCQDGIFRESTVQFAIEDCELATQGWYCFWKRFLYVQSLPVDVFYRIAQAKIIYTVPSFKTNSNDEK